MGKYYKVMRPLSKISRYANGWLIAGWMTGK